MSVLQQLWTQCWQQKVKHMFVTHQTLHWVLGREHLQMNVEVLSILGLSCPTENIKKEADPLYFVSRKSMFSWKQKCTFLWVEFGAWMHWHLFILVGCTLGHISVTLVAHMSCRDYEFESWSIITYTRWYWFLYGNLIMNPQHWCLPCTCSYVYHTCAGNHEKNAAAENEDPVTHTVHPGCSSPASAAVWNVYVHLPLAHLLCLPCVQWCLGVVPDHVLWKKTVSNKGKVIYIRKTTLKPPVYHFRQEGAVQWQPFW